MLVKQGYYINEMGLYAKPAGEPDSAEVLYSMRQTGENRLFYGFRLLPVAVNNGGRFRDGYEEARTSGNVVHAGTAEASQTRQEAETVEAIAWTTLPEVLASS